MHSVHIEMSGKMSRRDAEMFVGWLRHELGAYIEQGLELELEPGKKSARLELRAPSEALCAEALERFQALSQASLQGA